MTTVQKILFLVAFSGVSFLGFAKEPGFGADEKLVVADHFSGINQNYISEKPDVVPTLSTIEDTLKLKGYPVELTAGRPTAAVALDRMNILYIGIDNPVSVAATGASAEQLTISISSGMVTMVGPGKFIAQVSVTTDDCVISVFANSKKVSSSRFRVRALPVPSGTIGGCTSGDTLTSGAFTAQAGVGCYLKDCPFDLSYSVVGFNLTVKTEKKEVKAINNTGGAFSPEAKNFINQNVQPGTVVTIGNLFVNTRDGATLKLLPLVYFIK